MLFKSLHMLAHIWLYKYCQPNDLLLGCQGFMNEHNILNVFAYGIYEDDTSNCRYICPNWWYHMFWMLVTPYMCFFGMQNLLLICPNHIGEFTAASQCVNGAIFSGLCPTYKWIYLKRPCFLESARTKISTWWNLLWCSLGIICYGSKWG